MSEVLEYAAHLSQVIGARPGGTEEEQQASFFIEKTMSQKFGLETSVEEFNCNPNYELPRIICCIISVVLGILSLFLPLLLVPAIIVCLIMALLYIMEVMGVSPLNRTAKRGISQNIVAKYIPSSAQLDGLSDMTDPDAIDVNETAEEIEKNQGRKSSKRTKIQPRNAQARKRKIVILARYDTGKVCRELKQPIFSILDKIHYVEMGGLVLIPIVLFLRTVTQAEGVLLIVFNVLTVIGIIGAFLPILIYILHQTGPYSVGANNNAAGVAVMMEVARHISERAKAGQYSVPTIDEVFAKEEAAEGTGEAGEVIAIGDAAALGAEGDAAANVNLASPQGAAFPTIHGEEAVRASGMMPVDADLIYEEALTDTLADHTPEAEAARAQALVAQGIIPSADQAAGNSGAQPANQAAGQFVGQATIQPASAEGAFAQGAGVQFAGAQGAQGASNNQPPEQELSDIAAAFAKNSIAAEPAPHAAPITADSFLKFAPPQNYVKPKSEQKDVPDWFKKGIQKANENKQAEASDTPQRPSYRSKLSDALDAATSEPKPPEESQSDEAQGYASLATDERLIKMREQIMNAGAGLRSDARADATSAEATDAPSENVTEIEEETVITDTATEAAAADAGAPEKDATATALATTADSADLISGQKAAKALGDAIGEAASAAAAAVADFDEEIAADNIDITVTGKPDIIQKIEEARAAEVAATIQAAEEVAEQAAVADRTISYIPVAAELSTDAAAGEGAADKPSSLDGGKRKKRSISLPSLTGAIEAMADKVQDAPLADDAERAEGQIQRNVQTQNRRSRQNLLKDSLPSTDLPPKREKESVALASSDTTTATTSFLAAIEKDAQEALSSLDVVESTEAKAGKASKAGAVRGEGAAAVPASGTIAPTATPATTSTSTPTTDNVDKAEILSRTSPSTSAPRASAQARVATDEGGVKAVAAASATSSAGDVSVSAAAASLIPSMRQDAPSDTPSEPTVSRAGAFASANNTGAFEPVGDELIDGMDDDEIYIQDVDDSDYEEFTSFGAPTGPGYVEMPKSRASRFKGIFSRKKKAKDEDDISFSEAMGLEEDFDAREVGKARGGWESFRNNSARLEDMTSSYDSWEDDDWNGGAFSLRRKKEAEEGAAEDGRSSRSKRSARAGRDGARESSREGSRDGGRDGSRSGRDGSRIGSRERSRSSARANRDRKFGRGSSNNGVQRRLDINEIENDMDSPSMPIDQEDMIEERENIRKFRASSAPLTSFAEVAAYAERFGNAMADEMGLTDGAGSSAGAGADRFGTGAQGALNPADPTAPNAIPADPNNPDAETSAAFQTEVWFVALGAELADNAGVKAFLAAHPADLHGAVVIDLDAMGAGNLSFIDDEGVVKHVRSSTRMKRYVTKAGTSLGLHINSANINWRETAAYFTARKGLQTIHMAGMLDKKPAYEGEADDVLENLSEEKLLQNTAFVLELMNII